MNGGDTLKSVDLAPIDWGVASWSVPGETNIGDHYLVEPFSDGILTAVVDGLGHGERAAEVARLTIDTLKSHAHEPVDALMQRCHGALRGSRGVVLSLASFNLVSSNMAWLGVGNVSGLLVRANHGTPRSYERLLLRGGVVGYRLPTLRTVVFPLSLGDTLIFVTDGIRSGFTEVLTDQTLLRPHTPGELNRSEVTSDSPQQLASRILELYGRQTDDALVLVVRLGGKQEKVTC